MNNTLRAWCNGYEVVAARSEEEARDILLNPLTPGGPQYDAETVDGDGWTTLPNEAKIRDENGAETKETVEEAVRTLGKPGHLWSLEP